MNTKQFSTKQFSTKQFSTKQFSTKQFSTKQFSTKRQWLVRLMGGGLSLLLTLTPTMGLYAQAPVDGLPQDRVINGSATAGALLTAWPEFAPLTASAADNDAAADADLAEIDAEIDAEIEEVETAPAAAELAGYDYPEVGPMSFAIGPQAGVEGQAMVYTNHTFLPMIAGGTAQVTTQAQAAPIQAAADGIGTRADFNGDGYVDLAVGVPGETLGGQVAAGAVNVIYGSGQGLKSAKDQFWHQDSTGILGTAEAADRFGGAIATGDFDADGYGDLAVGAPGEDSNRGVVHILYGTAKGLKKAGNQVWMQDSLGTGNLTPAVGDRFGQTLATGDFNDDGYTDLAIGSPYDTAHGGAVQVLYGAAAGLTTTNSDSFLLVSGGNFGWALAAADFDNQSGDDLAIGAPDRFDASGQVFVIYGSNSGLDTSDQQNWRQGFNGLLGANEADDQFGWALATGDFDNDNFRDLVVGAPYEDLVAANVGAVSVIYGSAAGLTATNDQFWVQDSGGVADSSEAGDRFGWALATGRLDNDNYSDLIVGVPYETLGNDWTAQGMVQIFYGDALGLTESTEVWHQDSANIADSGFDYEAFGASLRTGDFDDDGLGDLAIGVPNEDEGGGVYAGAVHVLYSQNSGLSATGSQYWTQNSNGILDSAENDDYFGTLK